MAERSLNLSLVPSFSEGQLNLGPSASNSSFHSEHTAETRAAPSVYRIQDLTHRPADPSIKPARRSSLTLPLLGCAGFCGCNGDTEKPICAICRPSTAHHHVRIAGPSMAGKTSFVRYLQHGQYIETAPTNEMEVSKVHWEGSTFVIWDSRKHTEHDTVPAVPITANFGSKASNLVAARHAMDALIYVVDMSDIGRLRIAVRDIERTLKTFRRIPVVMVIGTKKNSTPQLTEHDLVSQLRIREIAPDKECAAFAVSAVTGEGFDQAMGWLVERVTRHENLIARIVRCLNWLRPSDQSALLCWNPLDACQYSRLH